MTSCPKAYSQEPLPSPRKYRKEQVLDEIRIHREEEFFARRFFKPFEISLGPYAGSLPEQGTPH
mgnify:CR=1 FL=1